MEGGRYHTLGGQHWAIQEDPAEVAPAEAGPLALRPGRGKRREAFALSL